MITKNRLTKKHKSIEMKLRDFTAYCKTIKMKSKARCKIKVKIQEIRKFK